MDQYRTVEHQGYFQRLKNSVAGVLIGIILFVVSLIVLWKNEGNLAREKAALKEIAAATVPGAIDEATESTIGKPTHLVGEISSEEQIGDPGYLAPGDYLKLRRQAEMYQWVEEERSETREKMGGGSETVKTYTYTTKWQSGRVDSGSFQKTEGHQNPEPEFGYEDFAVSESSFGAWNGNDVLDHLWPDEQLELSDELLDPEMTGGERKGNFIYFRLDPESITDRVGDERISWEVLYSDTFSVIAKHETENRLSVIVTSNGKEKFLVEPGTKSAAELLASEANAQSLLAWLLRLLGFILMWIGLGLTLAPVATLLSIIPVAASIGRFAIGVITFSVALGLSVTTIIISWVAHNPIVLGVAVAAGVGLGLWWIKNRQSTVTPPPAA